MISQSLWQEYNDLGVLDIVEHYDDRPVIVKGKSKTVVQYRRESNIFQRDVYYDQDRDAWYHYTDGDYAL